MKSPSTAPAGTPDLRGLPWWARAVVALLVIFAVAVVWVSNSWLTARFTETTRNRAELRLVLYSGNLLGEVQRNAACRCCWRATRS